MKLQTKPNRYLAYLLATIAAAFTITIVLFPAETLEASLNGLRLWWDIVLPALLPFFIISEILIGLGVVHFMGALLEPVMQPLFRVPGVGGFVVAIGLASGYPIGAKITARLREQEMISKLEAERLVCFTNTADPLFMVGSVAVGMFHNVALGATLAAAHYISSVMVGLTMRFWGKPDQDSTVKPTAQKGNIFSRALSELYQARVQDGRPLGKLLGDAVTSSMNTILLVGGFIILFSVLVKVMQITGAGTLLVAPIAWLLKPFQVSPEALIPLFEGGLFEITLGTYQASIAQVGLKTQLVLASAVIAWSGLSVHGQVAALISKTDMSYLPYLFARILHGLYAGIVTFLIFDPAKEVFKATPVFWKPFENFWTINLDLLQARVFSMAGVLGGLLLLALVVNILRRTPKLLPTLFHHR